MFLAAVGCQDEIPAKALPPPVAGLAHPAVARAGQTIVISAASTAVAQVTNRPDLSARIARFRFEVSDGTPLADTSAPEWTHAFAAPGSYDISVQVADDHGGVSTARSHIQVVLDMAAACTGTTDASCDSGLCGGEACLAVACAGKAACPETWLGPGADCQEGRCVHAKP